MKCGKFVEARVLEAYGEPAGKGWARHLATCEPCEAEAEEFRDVRRLYAEARPVRLHERTKKAILVKIRRERNRGRLRSAIAGMAGIAASALLLAGLGGEPIAVSAAEAVPAGSTVDAGIVEVRERIADVELGDRSMFDAELDSLKHRIGSMAWDAESM
jgi:hypothetical protein